MAAAMAGLGAVELGTNIGNMISNQKMNQAGLDQQQSFVTRGEKSFTDIGAPKAAFWNSNKINDSFFAPKYSQFFMGSSHTSPAMFGSLAGESFKNDKQQRFGMMKTPSFKTSSTPGLGYRSANANADFTRVPPPRFYSADDYAHQQFESQMRAPQTSRIIRNSGLRQQTVPKTVTN